MKDTEIEIQVKVTRIKKLLQFLKDSGKFFGEFIQTDEYYTPKHRSFTKIRPIKEWLRLRKSEKGNYITYKNWIYGKSGKSWHCDELETEIDDLKQIRKIFSALDLKLLCKVVKKRTIYKIDNYEISLDNVKGLGNFIEMEYKGKKKIEVKQAVKEMITFLKSKDCGTLKRNNGGYPFMLMFPSEVKFEELN
jgi:adenylate cyclase class 2